MINYYIDISNISTKMDFYQLLKRIINFPDYFGYNLDALYDCLCDLEWINDSNILLKFIGWQNSVVMQDDKFCDDILSIIKNVNLYWEKQVNSKLCIILQ